METAAEAKVRPTFNVEEKKFLFCLFLQMMSFERFMEIFVCHFGEYRIEVSSLFYDVLGFVFWANVGESDMSCWEDVFNTDVGFRFMRRGGLGQFYD
jgi:hypothetical protein